MKFNVFGNTSKGKGIIVEVEAENSAAAIEKARKLRPDCKFNHCNLG